MKKVKTKKKNRVIESETRPLDKTVQTEMEEEEISIVPKGKEKGVLKKLSSKEEQTEGLAAKWVGKNQWIVQIKDFFREVRIELKKVTWPSRKETMAATGMVIFLSIIVAFFLGMLDVGLAKAVGIILRRS